MSAPGGLLFSSHPLARGIRRVGRPVRLAARRLGIEIRPVNETMGLRQRRMAAIRARRVDLVIDAGANVGQFATMLRQDGYRGPILSIEPGRAAFEQLQSAAMADPCWTPLNMALGAASGSMRLAIAGNSFSSSLLEMLDTHVRALPASRTVDHEDVEVTTLDALVAAQASGARRIFLKMDVQGYEDSVLAGATATLGRVVLLESEVSFLPLYAGQKLFADLHEQITEAGFSLISLEDGFRDPHTDALLQSDALYVREDL